MFRIYSRRSWRAQKPHYRTYFFNRVDTVFIHTSVTQQLAPNASRAQEKEQMRSVQQIGFSRGFSDFSYSFGVFPSGRVYRGRGWNRVQAATVGYNSSSYSIATIGNTDTHRPTEAQIRAIIRTIRRGQRLGKIARKVHVRGHRSVAPKACPGAMFPDALLTRIERAVNG